MLERRKQVSRHRNGHATDGDYITGKLEFKGMDHPVVTYVANPLLSTYWALAQRTMRALGAKP